MRYLQKSNSSANNSTLILDDDELDDSRTIADKDSNNKEGVREIKRD